MEKVITVADKKFLEITKEETHEESYENLVRAKEEIERKLSLFDEPKSI